MSCVYTNVGDNLKKEKLAAEKPNIMGIPSRVLLAILYFREEKPSTLILILRNFNTLKKQKQ
jgi:hypothetical protein